jgi:hypothetical protein
MRRYSAHASEYGGIREQEQYGNNLRRKPSQMIPNDPKPVVN